MSEQVSYQFEETSKDEILWRYLRFEHFFALIETNLMHFTYPMYFEDPFEGCYSKKTIEALEKYEGREGEEFRRNIYRANNEIPRAVTCWHRQQVESWLMWKHYGADRGIAVVTKSDKLLSSIGNSCERSPMLGNVRYIDLDEEEIQPLNILNNIMHKQREFSAECETRLVIDPLCVGDREHYLTNAGILLPNNPSDWIERIVLSPELSFLEKALTKYLDSKGFSINVSTSRLASGPYQLYEVFQANLVVKKEDVSKVRLPMSIFIETEDSCSQE
ncbi:hypothetical protein C0431_09095 [bacterium]|nr:hypothetical protein [bacterium]